MTQSVIRVVVVSKMDLRGGCDPIIYKVYWAEWWRFCLLVGDWASNLTQGAVSDFSSDSKQ